jgi:hypothetical protein
MNVWYFPSNFARSWRLSTAILLSISLPTIRSNSFSSTFIQITKVNQEKRDQKLSTKQFRLKVPLFTIWNTQEITSLLIIPKSVTCNSRFFIESVALDLEKNVFT